MGILDDKRYEELDWVSKAVEPIEHRLSGILASLPDEFTVDFNTLCAIVDQTPYAEYTTVALMRHLVKTILGNFTSTYEEDGLLRKCFEFHVEPGTILDFEKRTIKGSIKLVKIKFAFEDQDLKALIGLNGLLYYTTHVNRDSADTGRCAEIIDILEANKDERYFYKTRSPRKKTIVISNRLSRLMRNNEWNIRSCTLADKVGMWCTDYINNGNLAAYANLCKLKVMTHKGLPIYSMEEV